MSGNQKDDDFVMETLIKISKDVGVIKTKVEGLEKTSEKTNEVFEKRLVAVEAQTEKNTKAINDLQNADDKKDAKRYRYILAVLGAGITGVLIAKLPDIIRFLLVLFTTK